MKTVRTKWSNKTGPYRGDFAPAPSTRSVVGSGIRPIGPISPLPSQISKFLLITKMPHMSYRE
ncbi:hypothetical protein PanWU01x14_297750, partial [Parasponia andersonii]